MTYRNYNSIQFQIISKRTKITKKVLEKININKLTLKINKNMLIINLSSLANKNQIITKYH